MNRKVKKIIAREGLAFVILTIFILGCGKEEPVVAEGPYRYYESLGAKFIPPQDWVIGSELSNFVTESISFVPVVAKKEARLTIGKNKMPEFLKRDFPYPSKNSINLRKETFLKQGKKIVSETKTVFLGKPAYFFDVSTPQREEKHYMMIRGGYAHAYGVIYWVERNSNYQKNIDAINKSLDTLEFK